MKKLFAFLVLMYFHLSHAAYVCPPAEIDVVDNGGGNYTFTVDFDFSGTDFTIADLSYINWNFADGTSSSGQLTVTHQYTADGNYPLTFSFVFSKVIYVPPLSSIVTCDGQSLQQNIVVTGLGGGISDTVICPPMTFTPIKQTDLCPTGEVTMSAATACDLPIGTWAVDSIIWNTGDGNVLTTYGIQNFVHQYGAPGPYTITAVGYVTNSSGDQCEVQIVNITNFGTTNDPCELHQDSTVYENFLEIMPLYAETNLYLASGSVCDTTEIELFHDPYFDPVPSGYTNWTYTILIDGDTVEHDAGIPGTGSPIYQTSYLDTGQHTVELIYHYQLLPNLDCITSDAVIVDVIACDTCASCTTFKPAPGERYWVSAWVKENQSTQVKTYENVYLQFGFTGSGQPDVEFYPSGSIVDGWQRIVGSFTIPANTTELDIQLVNDNSSIDAYFDDIRVHPFNASMKSYVYDPETLWLVAELDDNNYATFYEYDSEGQLVRIDKETARGVVSIQESRSSNPKTE